MGVMFRLNGVTLRPLERRDLGRVHAWACDAELESLSGWGRPLPRAAFAKKWRALLERDDFVFFAIDAEGRLVGRLDLALIDREHRRCAVGLVLDRAAWGRGIGGAALRLALDYAFTVENLDRVYAEVYAFNARAQRLMRGVGFASEGVLRAHDLHHGERRDLHVFGMLKGEFRRRHGRIIPGPETRRARGTPSRTGPTKNPASSR